MKMFEIGRLVTKTVGKDADKAAIIVDIIDDKYVMIDGNVKRKKCNINHLIPHPQKFDIHKDASTSEVKEILKKHHLLLEVKPTFAGKRKERKKGARPKHMHAKKEKAPAKEEKKEKKKPKKSEEEVVEEALTSAEG